MKCHSLVQFVFKSTYFLRKQNFKIHLFSFSNTKQTKYDGTFLNKSGKNFNLAKIFWNVRVKKYLSIIKMTTKMKWQQK